jgi:hypothetical protein
MYTEIFKHKAPISPPFVKHLGPNEAIRAPPFEVLLDPDIDIGIAIADHDELPISALLEPLLQQDIELPPGSCCCVFIGGNHVAVAQDGSLVVDSEGGCFTGVLRDKVRDEPKVVCDHQLRGRVSVPYSWLGSPHHGQGVSIKTRPEGPPTTDGPGGDILCNVHEELDNQILHEIRYDT